MSEKVSKLFDTVIPETAMEMEELSSSQIVNGERTLVQKAVTSCLVNRSTVT